MTRLESAQRATLFATPEDDRVSRVSNSRDLNVVAVQLPFHCITTRSTRVQHSSVIHTTFINIDKR